MNPQGYQALGDVQPVANPRLSFVHRHARLLTFLTAFETRAGTRSQYVSRVIGAVCVVFACLSLDCHKLTAQPSPRPASFEVAETLYDGGLKPGWQDWGWGPHDLSKGAARINLSQYGGWILHHDLIQSRYGGFVFQMLAPSNLGTFLQVQLKNGDDTSLPVVDIGPERSRKIANGWREVYVAWSDLNPANAAFDRVVIHAKTSIGSDWIQFDKLVFTRFDPKSAAATAASKRVKLQVNCRAPGHEISPYIYGVAGEVLDTGATARR